MSNALYDKGRNAFLTGKIDWVNDTIKAYLVDTADYTVDLANHEFVSSVGATARVGSGTLGSKTAVGGVADAADTTFAAVTGDQSEALVIYKDTGNESTSNLIAYIDSATGLPVLPNGGDIVIKWSSAASKIFKL